MTTAIDVRGLRKSFGASSVLNGIDLAVEAGSIFALLGPNGAGKTTLINILSTLVKADAGTAAVAGIDVATQPELVRGLIGLTGQSAAVDEVLTGDENLRMMGRLSGLTSSAAAARSAQLLGQFGLGDQARKGVKSYSGGMRRRLDLALSLIVVPPVLFLDEPTTGLDPRSRLELWDVIRGLGARGTTVLLTTQYLEEADQLADRIALIDHGRVIVQGTAAELKATTGGEVVELRAADERLIREIPTDGSVAGLRRAIDEIDSSNAEGSITIRKPSLDDVFLSVTAGSATRELIETKG